MPRWLRYTLIVLGTIAGLPFALIYVSLVIWTLAFLIP